MNRLLAITPTLDPYSGIGRYSRGLLMAIEAAGTEPVILTERGERSDGPRLIPARNITAVLKNAWRVRKFADAGSYDVIHALDIWPYGVYAYAAVLCTRRRLILSGVGTYSVPPHAISLKRFLFGLVCRRANAILCISAYTEKRIHDEFPWLATLHTVHISAELLPTPSRESVKLFEKEHQLASADPLILTVGEIKDRKGQRDTAEALGLLKKEFPNAIYCMVGGQGDKAYVDSIHAAAERSGISNDIRIFSGFDDEQMSCLYSLADVFVLASNNDEHGHFEGFGIVLLEAGQFGVPTVGTRDCGIEDAVCEGYSGFLVPQRNPAAIADAIRRVLGPERKKLQEGSRAFAKTFDWTETARKYITYYQNG